MRKALVVFILAMWLSATGANAQTAPAIPAASPDTKSNVVKPIDSPKSQPVAATTTTTEKKTPPPPLFGKQTNDIATALFSLAWKSLLALSFLIALYLAAKEWQRDSLVIEPFDMPKELQDGGLTGMVMSQLLSDHILELQRNARIDDDASDIFFVELPKMQVDLQLPGVAWSVRGVIRYLKQSLGLPEKRLLGEVIQKKSKYVMRLRTTSGRACDVPVAFYKNLDMKEALASAAEVAVVLLDPFEAASIHFANEQPASGYEKTIAALKLHLGRSPAYTHQDTYVLWASVHRALGQLDAMEEKLRLAESVQSLHWSGRFIKRLGTRYLNFFGSIHRERFEFQNAEKLFHAALRRQKDNIGAMTNLGLLAAEMRRFDEAERWFKSVIRLRQNSSRGYRGLGLIAMASLQFEEAQRQLVRAIDVTPSSRWSRINHIELLLRKGDYAGTLAAIEEFEKINTTFPPLFRVWGNLLRETGKFNMALAKYEQAIRLDPFDPRNHLEKCDALRRMGRFDDAITITEEILAIRKNLPEALRRWGEVLRDQSKLKEAEDKFRLTIESAQEDVRGRLGLADVLRRQHRYEEAIEVIEETLAVRPDWPDALWRFGDILRDQGDLNGAEAKFRQVADAAPKDSWSLLFLANVLRLQGRYDEAITLLERVLASAPDFSEALRQWGEILRDCNQTSAAESKFRAALQAAPHNVWAELGLVDILRRQRHFTEALGVVERLRAEHPALPDILVYWGNILIDQNNVPESITKYEEAIALSPSNLQIKVALAGANIRLERYKLANDLIEQTLEQRPDWPDALRRRAEVLRERYDLDGALVGYRKLIEMTPNDFWSNLGLADVLRRLGQYNEAMTVLQKIRTRHPESPDVLRYCGHVLRDQNNLQKAIAKFQETLDLEPQHFGARLDLADALRRQKCYDEALVIIMQVQAENPEFPDALMSWGRVLYDQRRFSEAEVKFRQAIEVSPHNSWAQLGLADILRLREREEEALAVMQSVFARRPEMPEAFRIWAQLLRDQGNIVGAEEKFRQAINLAPWELWPRLDFARFLRGLERYDEAIQTIEEILVHRPNWPDALHAWGQLLIEKGEQEAAHEKFMQAEAATAAETIELD